MKDGPRGSLRRPPSWLFALEPARALAEASTLVPASPLLRRAPRGDDHPVLVLPGFTADDRSTAAIRAYLRALGYRVHGWKLGRNLGPSAAVREGLRDRVRELTDRHGRKLSLVGWSLGGIYSREIARNAPEAIRQVITLGSPFAGTANSNVAWLFRSLNGRPPRDRASADRLRPPPPVPTTAIYSRTDGVAAWDACRELETDRTENIEVWGSHCGLGFNPLVLWAIADRLAQPEDSWRPFARTGFHRLVYG